MNTPPSSPPAPPTTPPPPVDASRGSLPLGFVLGWVTLLGGYGAIAVLGSTLGRIGAYPLLTNLMALAGILPWAGLLGLIVFFAVKNKPRTALGVALSIASMIGVVILLVAACFGLFALGGGNWH